MKRGYVHGSNDWYEAVLNDESLYETKYGKITRTEYSQTDGKGFPIFELDDGETKSIFERKCNPGLFNTFTDDKYYKVGKSVKVTFIEDKILLPSTHGINPSNTILTIVYVDIEE